MALILRAAGAFQIQGNAAQNQIEADRPPVPDPSATRSPTSTAQTPNQGTQTFAAPNTTGSSTSTNPSNLPEGAYPDTTTGTTGNGTNGNGTTGNGTSGNGTTDNGTTTDTTSNQTPYPPPVRAGW